MALLRHKLVFKEALKNGGNISKAMKKHNYSPATINNPKNVTETDSWKELMDKYLPDELLVEKHRELLNKKEVITKNNMTSGGIDVIPTGEIDVTAVAKGLDMAHKLKGKYQAEAKGDTNIQINVMNFNGNS